jgi:hypothetical protein
MAEGMAHDKSGVVEANKAAKPNETRRPWQAPVIEYVNLAWPAHRGVPLMALMAALPERRQIRTSQN